MGALNPDQIAEKWGGIAADYEKAFEGLTSQFAAEALRLLDLKPGERVLDVAAGTGAFSLLAARAGARVLATDFASGMVDRLRERIATSGLRDITAEVMDGQALAVPDASFDASVSVLGLIFFPDVPQGMAELRRVLRPGGRAAVVCWSDPLNLQLMSLVMRAVKTVVPDFEAPAPTWARLAGTAALTEQMRQAGFREVEVTTAPRSLPIDPETYWNDFASSVPPLAALVERLGPDRTAAVGRIYMESLYAEAGGGPPTIHGEVCIGIGRV